MRIGIDLLEEHALNPADPTLDGRIAAALEVLRDAEATLIRLRLPHYREARAATIIGATAEALAYHREDLASRWADYGAGARRMLAVGTFASGADFVQMQRVRRVGQRRMAELFTEVDLIVTPSTAVAAPLINLTDTTLSIQPIFAPIWNATSHPALCVPAGFTTAGLPLSMQIIGRPFDEAAVLGAGFAYQQRTDWHLWVPPLVRSAPTTAQVTSA